jgi:hypothetical protein
MAKRKQPAKPIDPSHIELEDANGNRVTVTVAHWRRWPQLSQTFRPVAETPDTSVSIEPPTGDKTEEN